MDRRKCNVNLYRDFLIANHARFSSNEMARVSEDESGMAHDSISRFLAEATFTPRNLWRRVSPQVNRETGYLICDDTLLDKRYSRENELARIQYSGAVHGLVNGICLVNMLWTDGEQMIPVDYRVYDKPRDDRTKNDHFLDMLKSAKKRSFSPLYVLMDSWYGSIDNLKAIYGHGWHFMTNLKENRQVNINRDEYLPVSALDFSDTPVKKVWLKGFGPVAIIRILDANGGANYVATSDLSLLNHPDEFSDHWSHRWTIEEFHRGIKQTTGIAKCYSTKASSQKTHIFASVLAFIKLELCRIRTGISWYEQKAIIARKGTILYLAGA